MAPLGMHAIPERPLPHRPKVGPLPCQRDARPRPLRSDPLKSLQLKFPKRRLGFKGSSEGSLGGSTGFFAGFIGNDEGLGRCRVQLVGHCNVFVPIQAPAPSLQLSS